MRNNDCNMGQMPHGMVPFVIYGYPLQSQMMDGMCDDYSDFMMPEIPSIPQQMAHGTPGAMSGMGMMWPFGMSGMGMMNSGYGRNALGASDDRYDRWDNKKKGKCPQRECRCDKCDRSSSCSENTPRMGVSPTDLEEEE